MSLNLYYNLYTPSNPIRAAEIASCFGVLSRDPRISKLIVLSNSNRIVPDVRHFYWRVADRPTYQDFFDAVKAHSSENDISIIINSDCFIDPRTTKRLERIKAGQAYCLTRHELMSMVPLRIDKLKSQRWRYDMQDCWAVRGPLREGMQLDFTMGRLGCDNRFAHELKSVGYAILDPCLTIRVLHYHLSGDRGIQRESKVPGPYAFPMKHGVRESTYDFCLRASYSLRMRLTRIRRFFQKHHRDKSGSL